MYASPPVLAFFNSPWAWIVVLFIALLLFGSRLPHVARNLGKGINEFKKGLNESADPGSGGGGAGGDDAARRLPAEQATRKNRIDETSV